MALPDPYQLFNPQKELIRVKKSYHANKVNSVEFEIQNEDDTVGNLLVRYLLKETKLVETAGYRTCENVLILNVLLHSKVTQTVEQVLDLVKNKIIKDLQDLLDAEENITSSTKKRKRDQQENVLLNEGASKKFKGD